ncbi:MAG: response regulator [Polyangiaceae bacterium]|nr:response regulator [Polyangiaceae bacterium]
MTEAFRVLVVEDLPTDAELTEREILKALGPCRFRRVETREEYVAALEELQPALIVSDFKLPSFDGLTALELASERCPDVPFIIVTGSMNEDTAVECMKAGAWDYVIKEHVKRLGPAAQSALARQRARLERRRAQLALEASEMRYRRLFEAAKDGVLILDADTGEIIDANPYLVELTGYPREDLLGKHLWDIGAFKDIAASRTSFAELQARQYVRYEDLPLQSRDGRRVDVEFVSNVYRVNGENVAQCNIRDITARKRSRDREQLARGLLQVLNDSGTGAEQIRSILRLIKQTTGIEAVGIRLREGDDFPYFETNGFPEHFVRMERYLCERDGTGALVREAHGDPVLACMCGNIIRGWTDPKLPFFTAGGSFWTNGTTELLASTTEEDRQWPTRNRCNREGYESVALVPLRSGDEIIGLLQLNDHRRNRFDLETIQFFEGMGASIGVALGRKRAERELQESKHLTDSIVENVPLMIFLKETQDLRFVAFNRAGEELLGYDRKDLIGKSDLELFPPEQAAFFVAKDREVLAGEALVDIPEEPIQSANKGLRLLHTRKVCIKATDGVTQYLLGISEDITERKRMEAEREKLEEQLRMSHKMEAIGSLAGGVAHDFNNLLSLILSHTEFAMEGLSEGNPLKDDLLQVKAASVRAAALTRQLLAFSRKLVLQPVALDLNDIAAGVEKMLRRVLGEDIEFAQSLAPGLGTVWADPGQIEQVLMNLVVNARDAMPRGGKLTIETANVELDEEYAASHPSVKPGSYVELAVTDTGCGMDERTKARLFEPFFTTKERGKGTGLGLSTVYGIVKQSGGSIWVYSEPAQGTTFKIYLPRELSATPVMVSKAPTGPTRTTGTETILVVEDDEALRAVTRRTLCAAGYTVLTARDGEEALQSVLQHTGDIHLLLTDVVMPRMGGRELAEALSRTRPALKVLYVSGYTDDAIVHHGVLDPETHFLAKPITAADLTRKVREVLDSGVADDARGHEQAAQGGVEM